MSYALVHKAVAERIDDDWDASATFIMAANQPGQPPAAAPWVRWSVRPATSFNPEVGADAERTTGLIYFQIFVPEGKGERVAFAIRDKVALLFSEARFTTDAGGLIRCERAGLDFVGRDSAGWSQFNSTVRYIEDAVAINAS